MCIHSMSHCPWFTALSKKCLYYYCVVKLICLQNPCHKTTNLYFVFHISFHCYFYFGILMYLISPRNMSDKLKFVFVNAIQSERNISWKRNENIFHETHILLALSLLLFQKSSHYLLNKGWNNLMRSDWLGAPNCLLLSPFIFYISRFVRNRPLSYALYNL